MILVGLPLDASASLSQNVTALNQIYQSLAAPNVGVTYDDAGQAVMANGQFTWTLPCLSAEPCTGPAGTNIVRAPDGVHFCPMAIPPSSEVWKSATSIHPAAAFRFTATMLAPALTPDAQG